MKTWQRIAMFMIYLIISLPFVFAQELSIQKFQGQDNARGYARAHDQMTIEVLAKIPGEDVIDKEQLRLYYEEMYTTFDSCNATGAGYHTCRIYGPLDSYEPIPFSIEMRDDAENMIAKQDETLNIDNQAPVITEINAEPLISNGEVIISYVAEDYALSYGDTSVCSGLKTITVKSGTATFATDSAGLGECTKDNALKINFDTAGTKQICITALDYVNFASAPRCQEVQIDKAQPTIEDVNILDQDGFILTHVHSGEARQATINAVITDDGEVDPESVRANFNQLNPDLPDFLAPDVSQNDIYSWENIPVSEVSTCQITVKARDILGNEKTENFPCTIKADDTPPTVTRLAADSTRNGVPLYGYDTQLIIEFEDKDNTGSPGIGLSNRNINLDLGALGGIKQPDVCSKTSGAEWQCSWLLEPQFVAEGPYTITLLADSSDDLGNTIGAEQAYDVIYDNTGPAPPVIIEQKVVTGEAGVTYTGGAVRGDYAQYKVRSRDFETAFANFSDIGGNDKEPATECLPSEGGAKDCSFIGTVILDGPYTANIGFSFYDDAQNKANTSTKLEIYAKENATTLSYWNKPSITCSPRVIDRNMASILPSIVTCRLDLISPNPKVTTLAITGPTAPDQCIGDVTLNVNDIYMINTAEGSTSPILFIKLEPKYYYTSRLNITCPINIYSKREATINGTKRYYVTPIPQTLNTTFLLPFYNNPMELAHTNIDAKINRTLDDTWNNMQWLGTLKTIVYYAELCCWIKSLIMNVITSMYLIFAMFTGVSAVLKLTTYGKGVGDATAMLAVGLCKGEEKMAESVFKGAGAIIKFLDSLCGIVNCKSTGMGAIGEGYLGGGNPLCQDPLKLKKYTEEYLPGVALSNVTSMIMPNIKDSLIYSTICLCLPGIISNVEKLRQINCWKAVCLYDYVKQQGYPVSYCDEMHGYFVCAFVVGEFFSLLPFVGLIDKIIDMTVTFLSDPVALFSVMLGGYCEGLCKEEGKAVPDNLFMAVVCALLKTMSTLMESTAAVKKMQDMSATFGKPPGSQYCDRVEDIKDEMEK